LKRIAVFLLAGLLAYLIPATATEAAALFQDGLLGLTQAELRAQLGPPQKIRVRMAAQRVYNYYSFDTWETILKDQMSGTMGEDVYVFTRDSVKVRYSFQFTEEFKPAAENPKLVVSLVDIDFLAPDSAPGAVDVPVAVPWPVPLSKLTALIPEFKPSTADDAHVYRSNLFIILIQEPPAQAARLLIKEHAKENYDWSLAYRLYSSDGFPARVRLSDTATRVEFSIDSVQFIRDRYKITHEPMVNPFSAKGESLPPPPEQTPKGIPKPRYAP
jgi:hypothetical protein